MSSASGLIRGNAALPLAHTFKERLPDYPQVPTFKELGYPELVSTKFGLAGPAGLPPDVAQRVNREIVKMTLRPDVANRLRQDGLVAETFTVDEFRNFIMAARALEADADRDRVGAVNFTIARQWDTQESRGFHTGAWRSTLRA